MSIIIPGVLVLLGLAAVFLVATARRRTSTGRLGRETRRSDAPPESVGSGSEPDADPSEIARTRADEARQSIGGAGGVPVPVGERGVARYEPVDEQELGVTRRQFFNRGILAGLGLGLGAFGAAALAFLWKPADAGGFGGKVTVGTKSDIDATIAEKSNFYNASAKVYIVAYPQDAIPRAEDVYEARIVAGMEAGYVALYQKCVHLGCRVPFCESSKWFECPCHGSKYNRVGEKRGGPAPRGLDRFPLEVSGDDIVVDTGEVIQGPPIGTDTTKQGQEGAPCV